MVLSHLPEVPLLVEQLGIQSTLKPHVQRFLVFGHIGLQHLLPIHTPQQLVVLVQEVRRYRAPFLIKLQLRILLRVRHHKILLLLHLQHLIEVQIGHTMRILIRDLPPPHSRRIKNPTVYQLE